GRASATIADVDPGPRPAETTSDSSSFQRLQALEDAICYRTARLAEPCGACGPTGETRCDEHACDLSLIAAYHRPFKALAGSLPGARERARVARRLSLITRPR